MHLNLSWRAVLNTKSKYKAEKLTQRVLELLGGSCTLLQCEIYWKNKSLHELTFSQALEEELPDKLVIEILNKISVLSSQWILCIPSYFTLQDYHNISGDTNTGLRIPGVVCIGFSVVESDSQLS